MSQRNIYTSDGVFQLPRSCVVYDDTRPIEIAQSAFKKMFKLREWWKAIHLTNQQKISVKNIVVMSNHAFDPQRTRTLWFVRFSIVPDDERIAVPIGSSFLWQLPYHSTRSVLTSVANLLSNYDEVPYILLLLIQHEATPHVFDPHDFPDCKRVTEINAHAESLMLLLVKPASSPEPTDADLALTLEEEEVQVDCRDVRPDFYGRSFPLCMDNGTCNAVNPMDTDMSRLIMQFAVTDAVEKRDVKMLCSLNGVNKQFRKMLHTSIGFELSNLSFTVRNALYSTDVAQLLRARDLLFANNTCVLDIVRENGAHSLSSLVRIAKNRDVADTPTIGEKRRRPGVFVSEDFDMPLVESNTWVR